MTEEDKLIPDNFVETPLIKHIAEFKDRLIRVILYFTVALIISYIFAKDIYVFLVEPLAEIGGDRRMIYTNLTEAFFTYMNLAFFAAALVSLPYLAIQVYLFLAPGLYASEKKFLLPLLSAVPVLFFMGAAFVYYFIMPMAWKFFISFENNSGQGLTIQLEAKVSEYLGLVMHLIIGFGISFQMPVAIILLAKLGIVTPEFLKRNRRYAIVIITIIAAILTPPDVFSQLGLAGALYALYEISIFGSRFVSVGKPQ